MPRTFLTPPGWPTPPAGWTPPVDWQPDPSWPAAPGDWVWWAEELPTDRPAELQTVGAAPLAPVHDTPVYAPGFQPTPPPPGFTATPGLHPTGGFLPTGRPQAASPSSGLEAGGFQPRGFQPSGSQPSGFQPGGFQPSGFPSSGFQPSRFEAGGFQSGGFPQQGSPAFGAVAPPTFLHIADQLRADAQRRILFGVVWLVGGIAVSVIATAVVDGALYFWGAALYGVVQVVRGLVGYGRADRAALARSTGMSPV